LGVSRDSGRAGEEILHAVLVPDFDKLKSDGSATVTDYVRFEFENVSQQLPPYKRVLSYEVRLTPLPRTTTRKIKRHEVRAQSQLASRGTAGQRPEPGVRELQMLESKEARALAATVSAYGKERALHPDAHLELELGFDSLARVELIAAVEERLGVRLDEQTLSSAVTVRDVIQALQCAAPADPGAARRRGRSWAEILAGAREDQGLQSLFRTNVVDDVVHYMTLKAARILGLFLMRIQVTGLEQLPKSGPYLLCPNHQSILDGIVISSVLPFGCTRRLYHLGQAEYFRDGLRARLGRWFRIVPVNSGTNLLQAMRCAAAGLGVGRVLSIYPEGERSIDGEIKPFKKGSAILARELNAPVVPVAIIGTYHIWSRVSRRVRRGTVRVRFGRPLSPAPFVAMADPEAAYAAFTEKLQAAVADLLSELDRRSSYRK
jgi:long-chain acyl-CoA synthetase